MGRKEWPLDVKFDTWDELIVALRYTYTTSFRDVCELLKASRNWVNQYIRPKVPCVYIGNNKTATGNTGPNWVRLASLELGKSITESIWFDTEELYAYLDDCTHSVTKQTKSVPVGMLMNPWNYTEYLDELKKIESQIISEKAIFKKSALLNEMNKCHLKYLSDDEQTTYMCKQSLGLTERKKIIAVNFPNIKFSDIQDWQAPHDLKSYGDADELIYRQFFKDGYLRIELYFPDKDGCLGHKIYYAPDPQYLKGDGKRIVIPESVWQKVKI